MTSDLSTLAKEEDVSLCTLWQKRLFRKLRGGKTRRSSFRAHLPYRAIRFGCQLQIKLFANVLRDKKRQYQKFWIVITSDKQEWIFLKWKHHKTTIPLNRMKTEDTVRQIRQINVAFDCSGEKKEFTTLYSPLQPFSVTEPVLEWSPRLPPLWTPPPPPPPTPWISFNQKISTILRRANHQPQQKQSQMLRSGSPWWQQSWLSWSHISRSVSEGFLPGTDFVSICACPVKKLYMGDNYHDVQANLWHWLFCQHMRRIIIMFFTKSQWPLAHC